MRKLSRHQILRRGFDNGFLVTAMVVVTATKPPHECFNRCGQPRVVRSKNVSRHEQTVPSRQLRVGYFSFTRTTLRGRGHRSIIFNSAVLGLTDGGHEVSWKCFRSKRATIQVHRHWYPSSFSGGVTCKFIIRWVLGPGTSFLTGIWALEGVRRFILSVFICSVSSPIITLGGCFGLVPLIYTFT